MSLETYSLYGGAVTLTFDPDKHIYRANGEIVEGATSILKVIAKPALVPWAANMAAEYVGRALKPGISLDEVQIVELCDGAKKAHRVKADQSASLGHLAHAWFDDHFSGRAPSAPVNSQLRQMTEAFLRFADLHELEILETEKRLYSRVHKFAGTTDLICMVDGELTIADYKTGSGLYPEMLAQLGGYDICWSEEMTYRWQINEHEADAQIAYPTRHMLINCTAKGELSVALSSRVQQNRLAFLNALNLSRGIKEAAEDLKAIKTAL